MKPRSIALLVAALFLLGGTSAWAADYAKVEKAVLNVTALKPGQPAVVALIVRVEDGFHAQSHTPNDENFIKFIVKAADNPSLTFYEPIYPPGKDELYKAIGDKPLNVYTGTITVYLPLVVKADAKPGSIEISGKVNYQACDDAQCYLPAKAPFLIKAEVAAPGQAVEPANPEIFKDYKPATTQPATQPRAAGDVEPPAADTSSAVLPTTADMGQPFLLESLYSTRDLKTVLHDIAQGAQPGKLAGADWSISYAFGIAFVVGLLFNIMPCVLPVLPLKAIGFYEVGQHHRSRSLLFGFVFSLGIIAVFAILAVPILVLKTISWGELFSKWWFIWPMVAVLLAMALGLFGAFTFRLPVGTYNFQPRHDTYSGNFLLGAFTAILATPCTAPLLPPLLVWAASQPKYGVPAMIMVGVGMASPYLFLSAFPELARKFPRTGPWSELFKQMMGFMLLAAAAFFAAGQLVHDASYWYIVLAVVVVAALFLVIRTWSLAPRALPLGVSTVIALVMLGGAAWWTARVTSFGSSFNTRTVDENFQPYSPQLFDSLRKQHKTVLVKFTANWCATCQVIEGTVYHDPAAWAAIKNENVVALKADFSHDNPAGQLLLNHLSTSGGIPLTAVYPPLDKTSPLARADGQ